MNVSLTYLDSAFQRAKPATKREMTQFHSDEYVDFLNKINPSNMNSFIKEQHKCECPNRYQDYTRLMPHHCADNVGEDCPVFDGLFDYCSISAGGSMGKSGRVENIIISKFYQRALHA